MILNAENKDTLSITIGPEIRIICHILSILKILFKHRNNIKFSTDFYLSKFKTKTGFVIDHCLCVNF